MKKIIRKLAYLNESYITWDLFRIKNQSSFFSFFFFLSLFPSHHWLRTLSSPLKSPPSSPKTLISLSKTLIFSLSSSTRGSHTFFLCQQRVWDLSTKPPTTDHLHHLHFTPRDILNTFIVLFYDTWWFLVHSELQLGRSHTRNYAKHV